MTGTTNSNARRGPPSETCPRCGGTGTLQDDQGLFSLSQICPQCGGRGTVVTTPCPTCRGTGVEHRDREVKVRIPGGVADGQRIRVKGKGAAGRGNAPSGDLYVVVRVGSLERLQPRAWRQPMSTMRTPFPTWPESSR